MFATTRQEAEKAYKIAIAHTPCKADFDRIFAAELQEVVDTHLLQNAALGYFQAVDIAIERAKSRTNKATNKEQ